MLKRVGHVVDMFVAEKRTRRGTRFGFVRFINVFNVEAFEKRLTSIHLGKERLIINVAKFNKDKAKRGRNWKMNSGNEV